MKKPLLIILVGFMIGCAVTPETREITESNNVIFENPTLRIKVADDFEYKGKHKDQSSDERSIGVKREMWLWESQDYQKEFYIFLNTITTGGAEFVGTINTIFPRDHEYYRSFPKTVERGGQKWYVDVIHYDNHNQVIFGRNSGVKKIIHLIYSERGMDNEEWKTLLERADKAAAIYKKE